VSPAGDDAVGQPCRLLSCRGSLLGVLIVSSVNDAKDDSFCGRIDLAVGD